MNVAWQRETTTATVDVNDYYLLRLLSPNLQQKALCCWRLNDWQKETSLFSFDIINGLNLVSILKVKDDSILLNRIKPI